MALHSLNEENKQVTKYKTQYIPKKTPATTKAKIL